MQLNYLWGVEINTKMYVYDIENIALWYAFVLTKVYEMKISSPTHQFSSVFEPPKRKWKELQSMNVWAFIALLIKACGSNFKIPKEKKNPCVSYFMGKLMEVIVRQIS